MAISATPRISDLYNGNGVTTEFAYPFKVLDASSLEVRLISAAGVTTVQTLNTQYTVSGVGDDAGGIVTMITPPATGEKLIILGAAAFAQPLVLVNQGPYFAVDVMRALDRCTILAQQLDERLSRAVVVPPQTPVNDLEALVEGILTLEAVAAEIALVAGSVADVTTVAGNIADVSTVAGISTAVSNLAALGTEIANLNAIRTQIAAVDANSADISTVAGINAAVSVLAAIEADITAVAAIAAAVVAVAAIDGAVVQVAQQYQGASATDPTVRLLDGSALQVGDYYLNTVSGDIRFVTSTGPVVWSELTTLINEGTLAAMGVTASADELNTLDGIRVTGDELNIGSQALENRIINGAFDMWLRGTSSGISGYGAADRWLNSFSSGTVVQSRQAFSPGADFGQNRPSFRLRQSVSGQAGAGGFAVTQQRIEGVGSYNGHTITVLGFARRHSGAGNMAIEASQSFGTGGSPSASVTGMGAQQIALTADWQPFAAVIPILSITGKTIGTNGNDYLGIGFWASAGTNFAAETASLGLQTIEIELWGVHIRIGTFAAGAAFDYVQPDIAKEQALCERYYQAWACGQWENVDTIAMRVGGTFRTRMRATPTIVNSGGTAAIAAVSPGAWTCVLGASGSGTNLIGGSAYAEAEL